MNSFQIIGPIKDVQHKEFESGAVLTSFTLVLPLGNGKSFVKCRSWEKAFTAIGDGMVFELTRYYPKSESYVDRNGEKKTAFYIMVENMRYVGFSTGGIDWGELAPKVQQKAPETQPMVLNEIMKQTSVEDLFKKAEKLDKESQEEEIVDLDWMDELGVEKPKYDQNYINEIEKINSSIAVEVQDGEAGTNRQETGE